MLKYSYKEVDFDPFSGPEITKISPSTLAQREIWTSCQIGGNDANLCYNESLSLSLKGQLKLDLFEQSVNELVNRHEALRTVFSGNGTQILIQSEVDAKIDLKDIRAKSPEDQDVIYSDYLFSEANRPFDLTSGPLVRMALFLKTDTLSDFVLTAHHIVCDGWTLGVLLQDLSKIYNSHLKSGTQITTPAPAFSDYATEQTRLFNSEEYQSAEKFWVEQFKNFTEFEIPTDYERPAVRTYKSKRDDFKIDPDIVREVRKLSTATGTSFVTTLLASFEIFLYQYSGRSEIVTGLPAAGQSATGNYGLAGHCVNLLPLKTTINPSQPFNEYLSHRKVYLFDAFENQQITFGGLLNKLNIPRSVSRIPLVPVVFNVDIGMDDGVAFDGMEHQISYNPRCYETFEMFFNISGRNNDLTIEWSYNTQLFKVETIARLNHEFQTLLKNIVSHPGRTISELLIRETPVRPKVVNTDYPQIPLTDLISATAVRHPDTIAVQFHESVSTYTDLELQSNQVANVLLGMGIKIGDRVAVSIQRSIEMVPVLLGILKCGAAYIPLDPEFPNDRLVYMLDDSHAAIWITCRSDLPVKKETKILDIDCLKGLSKAADNNAPKINFDHTNTAYIIYTSGSTGKPKGVEITHKNLVNFLWSMKSEPGLNATDRLLALTTISFDIAGLELFLPLITGATLVIADKETTRDGRLIAHLIEQEQITMLQATPSTWKMILDTDWSGNSNLKALCGGEALSKILASKLIPKCGSLWNMYGPTETTIWSTLKKIESPEEEISIGKPIPNTRIYLLDPETSLPVPEGKVGEICIGGDGVGLGYLNRPELSTEKFMSIDGSKFTDQKIYRTGDLGRFTNDGQLICLGRIDHQVKIRGHRIELNEIEHHINQISGIKESVVAAIEGPGDSMQLIAYIIRQHAVAVDSETPESWKTYLASKLPPYMVPSEFVEIDQFPLTPNGKIDRKKLPKPERKFVTIKHQQPNSKLEAAILAIWREVLLMDDIDISANFFELGGHSLLAVQLMHKIQQITDVNLPIAALFTHSTIKSLAQLIEEKNAIQRAFDSLVPIKPKGSKPPLFIVHGGGLNVLIFKFIAEALDKEQPVFGLQPKGLDGTEEPLRTIESIAKHYNDAILAKSPNGPYLLAGYSMGGMIALEMAKQLKQAGKEVSLVAMLDTYAEVAKIVKSPLRRFRKKLLLILPKSLFLIRSIIKNPKHSIAYRRKLLTQWLKDTFKFGVQTHQDQRVTEAFAEAFNKYTMLPYDGEILVLRAKIHNYYLPDFEFLGWKKYTKKGVRVFDVDGDHRSMLLPPLNVGFARTLQNCLDEAAATQTENQIAPDGNSSPRFL